MGKKDGFKVIGYYFPNGKDDTGMIQYEVLTHINYAFVIPKEDGTLRPLENPETAKKVIKEAREHGVKVFITVGGWSYEDIPLENTFVAATDTEEKIMLLADNIVAVCEEFGFDGVDLDWEHPRVAGSSSKQYETLVVELAKRIHALKKEFTIATLSGAKAEGDIWEDAAAHTDTVLKTVDWVNVMAYDGGEGEKHSTYEFMVNCAKYWKETRELPAEKVIMGVPFYSMTKWACYKNILKAAPDAWKVDHIEYDGADIWYNGVETIEKKTAYALENLGGVMIWEISQDVTDEHSLQTAIARTIEASK